MHESLFNLNEHFLWKIIGVMMIYLWDMTQILYKLTIKYYIRAAARSQR